MKIREQIVALLKAFRLDKSGLSKGETKIQPSMQVNEIYFSYKNEIKSRVLEKNEEIEKIKPFVEAFNEKRFWFVENSSSKKISLNDGELLVSQDGQSIIAKPGEYLKGGRFIKEQPNTQGPTLDNLGSNKISYEFVYLYRTKKFDTKNENLYVNIEGDYSVKIFGKPMIRFYFNLKPDKDGILAWSEYLTQTLNSYRIPFQLKYPLNLNNYKYSDSGVLYVSQNHYELVASIISNVYLKFKYESIYSIIDDSVPLFTQKLYPGIAFAEDPYFADKKESFGMQRCKLIFDTIIAQQFTWTNDEELNNLAVTIEEILISQGYSHEFFRNPNTNYQYDFEKSFNLPQKYSHTKENFAIQNQGKYLSQWGIIGRERYLSIARAYADELMERAIWNPSEKYYFWITYDQNPVNKDGFYRIISRQEIKLIRYFLYKLSDFVEDKNHYRNFARKTYRFGSTSEKLKIEKLLLKFVEDRFSQDKRNNFSWNKRRQMNSSFNHIFNNYKNLDEKNNLQTISSVADSITEVASFIIENYENTGVPLVNEFNNYEYCANENGKLITGLFFLFAYKPKAFLNEKSLKEIE